MVAPLSDRQDVERLAGLVADTMQHHWREPGFTCPNAERYPWMWLWDSCFHALVWERLGDHQRAVRELRSVFVGQDPATGFVPHMAYFGDPHADAGFWGREGFSSITQPPMFGHTVAELLRRGVEVPDELVASARGGLAFLLTMRRRHDSGLVELVHPWESGADDSPRWDSLAGTPYSSIEWHRRKGALLDSVERTTSGAPLANPAFGVASVAFNALVAFNAVELAEVTGDETLRLDGVALAAALEARWDGTRHTWIDAGPTESGSGGARSVEGLLVLLVSADVEAVGDALASLVDPRCHGARFGPTGVDRREPTFDPMRYWRGSTWPQLSYLLWLAARRHGNVAVAASLADSTVAGALASGLSEYWHPDTAQGGGAAPQSWTGLALLMNETDTVSDAITVV